MADDAQNSPRWAVAPYFVIANVVVAAAFYRERLGFGYERLWGNPLRFAIVHVSGVRIMLGQIEGATPRPTRLGDPQGDAWDAYVWGGDADALHDELAAKGVQIVRGLCSQIYACRAFERSRTSTPAGCASANHFRSRRRDAGSRSGGPSRVFASDAVIPSPRWWSSAPGWSAPRAPWCMSTTGSALVEGLPEGGVDVM